jgi:hypothetical protein
MELILRLLQWLNYHSLECSLVFTGILICSLIMYLLPKRQYAPRDGNVAKQLREETGMQWPPPPERIEDMYLAGPATHHPVERPEKRPDSKHWSRRE